MEGEYDPDCVVPAAITRDLECGKKVETVRNPTGDVRRLPHYLSSTASLEAKRLPTRKWTKPESRLPPRMVVLKRVPSPPLQHDSVVAETAAAVSAAQEAAPVATTVPTVLPSTSLEGATPASVEPVPMEPIPMETSETIPTQPALCCAGEVKSTPEESSSGTPKKSISTSPDRDPSLPAKEENTESIFLFPFDDVEPACPEQPEGERPVTDADIDSHFRNWDVSRVPVPKPLTPEQEEMAQAFIEMQEELADKRLTKYLLEQGMELSAIKKRLAEFGGRR